MLKLKTKTEFPVANGRNIKNVIVRLIVESLAMDRNNVIPKGYYYYFDENGQVVLLDRIVENPILWSDIALIEQGLAPLQSATSLYSDLMQRLGQLVNYKLHAEGNTNYGASDEDFEIDND